MQFYRKIYRLAVTLTSPLSIGSGMNEHTDKDVLVDSVGVPFLPATSLAGVLRSYVAAADGTVAANRVFGYIPDSKEARESAKAGMAEYQERECLVRIYDGRFDDKNGENFFIANRDMVALKDKVVDGNAKFDMEAIETGARFTAFIELLQKTAPADKNGGQEVDVSREIEAALAAMNAGELHLGTKTSRGYGEVSLEVKSKEFTDAVSWIDFDMMQDGAWDGIDPLALDRTDMAMEPLTLGLRLKGGLSIREYTTEPGTEKETMPDYRQLALHVNGDDGTPVPVIPGTSWAGAIRARFLELSGNDQNEMEELFGFVHQNDNQVQKSRIVISESRITGGVWKTTTRNAIDRFSGGTKNGALYTEKTYYGGTTELKISFAKAPTERQTQLLCACLADLHNGFLAVGGLTSVGRGLFEILSVNGRALSPEERESEHIYETLTSKKEVGLNE